jgi:hypothetical protein
MVTVVGNGSSGSPFTAGLAYGGETGCDAVAACVGDHLGAPLVYDPDTGLLSAQVSSDPGNNLAFGTDGGLWVPTGAATVSTGCGLTGDGSGSAPVTANTVAWPYACSVDTSGGGVYCDSTGQLRSDPPPKTAYFSDGANTNYNNITVPASLTTVVNAITTFTNPDPCRTATVIVNVEVDASFVLPPGASGAYTINGDEMYFVHNGSTSATVTSIHVQTAKTFRATVPPGGTFGQATTVGFNRGAGGARYNRIQWTLRAFLFSM